MAEAIRDPLPKDDRVAVSLDGSTVWVHGDDGSTVGRYSKRFGLDVHRPAGELLAGGSQCLHCTHHPASPEEWDLFCDLMLEHFGIDVDRGLVKFSDDPSVRRAWPGARSV